MAGHEERYQNHYCNVNEEDQDASFYNVSGLSHHILLQTGNNGESSHYESPSNRIELNPQGGNLIGLSLRKSTSLINLLEMSLTQERQHSSQPCSDKLKASNFPAICSEIGNWKWVSKNEGDLVAKVYYAKKKLVWEFLFGSLKKKIEISWSNISAINAFINEGENGRLEIELNEPPQFYEEFNSQPRKHTQWATSTDFTEHQALICRRHTIEFSPGVLDKHIHKLFQCDNRLLNLSQKPFPTHNSPFFSNEYLHFSSNSRQLAFRPSGPFVEPSHSNSPSPVLKFVHTNEMQRIGAFWEQENNQFQGNSSYPVGEQSWSMNQQLELHQNTTEFFQEQNCFGANSTSNPFIYQQQVRDSFWLTNQVSIDDGNTGGNGICSVDESGVNDGFSFPEPNSWLPFQVNTNEGVNVLPMEDYGS